MIEVEIRTIVKNPKRTEEALRNQFPLVKQKHQIDMYFSHPSRNFYGNPQIREYLRIRTDKSKSSLDYHKAFIKDGKKTHTEELEAGITEPKKMEKILVGLGFKTFVVVDKERKIFDCKDFEASLDKIKSLGSFLEIEAKKDFGGIKETTKECTNFLKKTGLDYIPAPDKGYPDMLIEKNLYKNNKPENTQKNTH